MGGKIFVKSKCNIAPATTPGPSQPKVRMFKRIVRLTVLISLLLCIATDGKAGSEGSCGGRMDWSKFDEQATSRTPGGMSRFTFCKFLSEDGEVCRKVCFAC